MGIKPRVCQENIPHTFTPPSAWTVDTRQVEFLDSDTVLVSVGPLQPQIYVLGWQQRNVSVVEPSTCWSFWDASLLTKVVKSGCLSQVTFLSAPTSLTIRLWPLSQLKVLFCLGAILWELERHPVSAAQKTQRTEIIYLLTFWPDHRIASLSRVHKKYYMSFCWGQHFSRYSNMCHTFHCGGARGESYEIIKKITRSWGFSWSLWCTCQFSGMNQSCEPINWATFP